jgi:hypothetical protein
VLFLLLNQDESTTRLNFSTERPIEQGELKMNTPNKTRITAPKPRNPFVAFMMRRKAGAHRPERRAVPREEKDLVQRLREAGL